jgi:hypothetical protein
MAAIGICWRTGRHNDGTKMTTFDSAERAEHVMQTVPCSRGCCGVHAVAWSPGPKAYRVDVIDHRRRTYSREKAIALAYPRPQLDPPLRHWTTPSILNQPFTRRDTMTPQQLRAAQDRAVRDADARRARIESGQYGTPVRYTAADVADRELGVADALERRNANRIAKGLDPDVDPAAIAELRACGEPLAQACDLEVDRIDRQEFGINPMRAHAEVGHPTALGFVKWSDAKPD